MRTPCRHSRAFRSTVAFAVALGAALSGPAGPAGAQDGETRPPAEDAPPGAPLDELNRFLDQLEGLLEGLPRYEMPEITEDGDIILRRRADPEGESGEGAPEPPGPDGPEPPRPPVPPEGGGGEAETLEL
ncbi:MAG: hypothetical protein RID91_18155 [Azospirillaceae bacterium]